MVNNYEPLTFSIGDTLAFNKNFPCFQPSAGWQLQYQIRGGAGKTGGLPDVGFSSTPDATNTIHQISVAAAVTAVWSAGEYLLVGYAVNAGLSARHEIYNNTVILTPNFNTPVDNVSVQTFAQQQICSIQKTLAELSAIYLIETDVQQTKIVRAQMGNIRKELSFWEERRANEVAQENVNNGRPSGNKIRPVMNVVSTGCNRGIFGTWPFPQ